MNILLICAAGLSTSLLVTKVKEYAKSIGDVPNITAQPANEVEAYINDYDVIMLGPQIRHKYEGIVKKYGHLGKPIVMIDSMDYGLCRGKEVYEKAKMLVNK